MASNDVSAAQFVVRFDEECEDHPGEKIQRYCKTCKKILCIDCITSGKHSDHTLTKLEEIYLEEKRDLAKAIEDIRESDLGEYTNKWQDIKRLKDSERIKKKSANVITKIKERSNEIKAAVDIIEQELTHDVVCLRDQLQTQVADSEENLRGKTSAITTLLKDHERKMKSTSLKTIMNSGENLRDALWDLILEFNGYGYWTHETSDVLLQRLPDFSPRRLSSTSLKEMFGRLRINDNIPFEIVWEHVEYRGITGIAATSNGVWMCRLNNSEIEFLKLSESSATYTFKTTFRVDVMCMSDNGNILATQLRGSKVFRLGIGGMVEKMLDISPHKINGICKLRDGGFAVTITGQTNGVEMRGFIKIAVDGSRTPIRQTDSSTGRKLFTDPKRLTENVNDDICVVDDNTVVAIDREGKMRFRYSASRIPSALADISSSSSGHIFVADLYNDVYVLSATGAFVTTFAIRGNCDRLIFDHCYKKQFDSISWTVCVGPDDRVFIGTHVGKLRVFKQETSTLNYQM